MSRNSAPRATHVIYALATVLFVFTSLVRAADDPFIGNFSTADGAKTSLKVHVTAGDVAGNYTGTIEKNGDAYPLTASRDQKDAGHISGTFRAGKEQFPLDIVLGKDRLTLTSGDLKFDLTPLTNPPDAPAVKAGATVVLVPQKVVDEAMHMDAVSLLVPQGWKLDGQVTWIPPGAGLAATFIAVLDPNTQAMAQFYPQITYVDGIRESQIRVDQAQTGGRMRALYERQLAEGNITQSGAEIRHIPATPLDYLKDFLVPRYRPDLKGVEVRFTEQKDLPQYAAKVAGHSANAHGVSSRIRIAYSQHDQKFEEIFICTLVSQPIGVGPSAWSIWSAEADSYRAPEGKLDGMMPIFLTVHDSISKELPWFNLYAQIGEKLVNAEKEKLQAMIRDTAVRMDAMHEYARQAQAEVSDRIRKNFEDQQSAKAAAHDTFMDYVNDLQKVRNPSTGQTIKVPSGYSRVYESSNGGLIATNDPTYAPPATPNTSWTQLEATK